MAAELEQGQHQLEGQQQTGTETRRKLVILCIHGFRQNAKQFKVTDVGFGPCRMAATDACASPHKNVVLCMSSCQADNPNAHQPATAAACQLAFCA
jgi:hypothetical protein